MRQLPTPLKISGSLDLPFELPLDLPFELPLDLLFELPLDLPFEQSKLQGSL